MSWRDTLKARSEGGATLVGRFRSARFIVPGSEVTVGRRAEVHEYPLRDIPYVEDLGRKARQFVADVFVDGSLAGGDYLAARDALIAALEEAGPGTLVHPWYGTLTVSLAEPAVVRESTREGGRASFRLTFIESGELRFPTAGTDTAWQADAQADSALEAASGDFAAAYDVDGLPAWAIDALADDIIGTLAAVEAQVSGAAAAVAADIRTPGNLAAAIVGAVQRLGAAASEPLRALVLYKRLFDAGSDSLDIPITTATRRRQASDSAALHRLTRQAAVVEACRSASRASYASRDEALATGEALLEALDAQMEATDPVTGSPIGDSAYQALASLRAAVATDLRVRGERLPELVRHTPAATLPALVVAHRLYGDAARDGGIVERNHIRHPGFVPGGIELEVLNA